MSAGAPSADRVDALEFVPATRDHKNALSRFICTDPPRMRYAPHRGRYHHAPWELDVQSALRVLSLPTPPDEAVVLGMIDDEVATVSYVSFDAEGEQLLVRAVARAWKFRGHGLGRVALDVGLTVLRDTRRAHALDCGIWARAHKQNLASLTMLADAGFEEILGPDERGLISLVLDR